MNNIGLIKVIIHPQWGAPMEYHKLIRSEADIQSNETYVSFASYYNKSVHDSDGMSMSVTSVRIPKAIFDTAEALLQAVIDDSDNTLTGGELEIDGDEEE